MASQNRRVGNRYGAAEDFKVMLQSAILAAASVTGLVALGMYVVKKIRTNKAQNNSLEEGDPATYAKQLKMAFDNDNSFGWGTNEEVIFQVFRDIPSKSMYSKVQKQYTALYNRNLNADLEDELSSEEYNEVIRIVNSKS